jgi:hypothetical protein
MKPAKRLAALALLGTACVTISACGQPERPRVVSDFCLNDVRLSSEPAPAPDADDPGNLFDTDQTFAEILAHNEVHDRLCPPSD